MLMIRFQRIGRKNDPAFRIAVLEKERAAKAGGIVAQVGTYNPKTKALTLDGEAVKGWISKGAQPTDSVHNLLLAQGVITGTKRNVLPKKTVPKKEEPVVVEAPKAPAASEAAPVEAPAAVEPEAAPAEVAPEAVAEEVAAPEEAPAA